MIAVEGVTKRFGHVHALAGVSFEVAPGQVVALLGPNGAGKTTLVRMLATLLAPDEGVVRIDGIDAAELPAEVRRRIGLAGQFAAVDELLTGEENLVLVGQLYGLDRATATARARALLAELGLEAAAGRRAATYSGGMRRRLDLGATLVGSPAALLLDEPTTGLDPRSRHDLWDHVRALAAAGTAIVLTSQNLEEVEQLASHVVVLGAGRVIAEGSPSELQRRIGGHVLEARPSDPSAVPSVVAAMGASARADEALGSVRLRGEGATVDELVGVAGRLGAEGIDVAELSLRLPSLDDVFFSLTGEADDDPGAVVTERRGPAAAAIELPTGGHLLRDIGALTRRSVLRQWRTPQVLFFGTVQPVIFVLGLTAIFGGLVERFVGGRYIDFLLPGVVVMNVVLAAGSTGIGLAEDMKAGIIDRFRSLPISRSAVLAARTTSDLVRNAIAMVLMVAAGFLLGFRLRGSLLEGLAAVGVALLFGYAATWVFAAVGLAVKDPQAAQFAGFAPVLPLVFLSSSWLPVETMDGAVRAFARNQPVNAAVVAVRSLTAGTPDGGAIGRSVAWSLALLVVFVAVASRQYARRT